MQSLTGTLIQCDMITPKPNKETGVIKEPYCSLSVQSRFSKFGRIVPEIVTVSVPLEKKQEYDTLVGKKITINTYFPYPQYSLMLAE